MTKKTVYEIDPYDLGNDLQMQAPLVREKMRALAEARRDMFLARNAKKAIIARTKLQIRSDPAAHGLTKTTEDVIECAATIHPDVLQAEEDAVQKQYIADILEADVVAINDNKRPMLENYCYLHSRGYDAEPRLNKVAPKVSEEDHYKSSRQASKHTSD